MSRSRSFSYSRHGQGHGDWWQSRWMPAAARRLCSQQNLRTLTYAQAHESLIGRVFLKVARKITPWSFSFISKEGTYLPASPRLCLQHQRVTNKLPQANITTVKHTAVPIDSRRHDGKPFTETCYYITGRCTTHQKTMLVERRSEPSTSGKSDPKSAFSWAYIIHIHMHVRHGGNDARHVRHAHMATNPNRREYLSGGWLETKCYLFCRVYVKKSVRKSYTHHTYEHGS